MSLWVKQNGPQTRHRARRQRPEERHVGSGDEEMVSLAHPSIHPPISAFQLTSNSGLVDFEMWDPYPEPNKPDPNDLSQDPSAEASLTELRKWGLAHKPPAKNWWAEFGIVTA
jgi:hypothetical protein